MSTAYLAVSCYVLRSLQNMSEILQYLSWATVYKYASEIVVANEFHNLNLTCEEQLQGKFADCRERAAEKTVRFKYLPVYPVMISSLSYKVTLIVNNNCKVRTKLRIC